MAIILVINLCNKRYEINNIHQRNVCWEKKPLFEMLNFEVSVKYSRLSWKKWHQGLLLYLVLKTDFLGLGVTAIWRPKEVSFVRILVLSRSQLKFFQHFDHTAYQTIGLDTTNFSALATPKDWRFFLLRFYNWAFCFSFFLSILEPSSLNFHLILLESSLLQPDVTQLFVPDRYILFRPQSPDPSLSPCSRIYKIKRYHKLLMLNDYLICNRFLCIMEINWDINISNILPNL